MAEMTGTRILEMTVTDREGKTAGLEGTYGYVSNTGRDDPYRFYASESPDNPSQEGHEIIMTLPLGGDLSGLYRFPRIGEKILVAAGPNNDLYYMMGYIALEKSCFHARGEAKLFEEQGEVFRYRQTGKAAPPEEEAYSEIGFYHRPTGWKVAGEEQKDYAAARDGYARIDRINIHSTGDIHESAVNHHRSSARRLELLADCDGVNTEGRRPLGDGDGDDSNLYAGDAHVRAKNRLVLKAGEEIRIQVGRSAIIISDDGITITSKKAQKNTAVPWDTVINLTPRDGITLFGQSVNVGAAHSFALRESAGGAVSSLGGVMRLSARDLLAQSYCKAGYQANMADFIKLYTATAKGMSGKGDVPSYTALLPSLVQTFSGINWGYHASTTNYSDPTGDYAAYCGVLLEILSLTYTSLDLSMDEEMKQNGGRDAFNAAALADQQEKVQEMLKYIDEAGDPARAIHNSFMHLTSSADAVLSGYDNERLSVNTIDSTVPAAGTSPSLIAKETARLQKGNSAEASLRAMLQNEKNRVEDGALWSLGMDEKALNKLKEL
ncbi:MAG: hypothetical protein LBC51_08735 [Treponema sp.]|jgi:hypothetical protein|nr:hypothetical protein [Treponema sp.]